ncbi:hypothetical protein [Paenibacillus motobuensis]|uniref:Beta-ketoacyl synthase N-terminal domain-containing protein n=1 Tax=Paenibacillus motobuensis TaxID=295324 RepID=A0ABP3HNT8_9BACL
MRRVYLTCMDSSVDYAQELAYSCANLEGLVKTKKLLGADTLTKVSRSLAKHNEKYISGSTETLGLIYATEYGNLNSMITLSTLALSDEELSTRVFPNATICSASIATSMIIQSHGLNMTLNGGYLGYGNALEIAYMYILSGKLDTCLVMTGDDYNDLSTIDILKFAPSTKNPLSNVTLTILSSNKYVSGEKSKCYFIEHIKFKNTDMAENKDIYIDSMYGNSTAKGLNGMSSKLRENKVYAASSFPFFLLRDSISAADSAERISISFGLYGQNEFVATLKSED